MLKLGAIFDRIQQKADTSLNNLVNRLSRNTHIESSLKLNQQTNKSYVHTDLPKENNKLNNHLRVSEHLVRERQNASENGFTNGKKIRTIRNSSSNVTNVSEKELQKKKELLMLELKEIDLSMKNKHKEEYIEKIKRNKTESEFEAEIYEKAARLVQKMNHQRKEIMQKKRKEALSLKHTVEQSIKKFQEMEEQKKEQIAKRKQQIEQRIQRRKSKAVDRQKINKISNIIIKELKSYKISLPDIYSRKVETVTQQDEPGVMLTNVQELKNHTIDFEHSPNNRESRVSSFLQNIHKEELDRKRDAEKIKQYQKKIREKHIEFGKKLRINQKQREIRLSRSKLNQ